MLLFKITFNYSDKVLVFWILNVNLSFWSTNLERHEVSKKATQCTYSRFRDSTGLACTLVPFFWDKQWFLGGYFNIDVPRLTPKSRFSVYVWGSRNKDWETTFATSLTLITFHLNRVSLSLWGLALLTDNFKLYVLFWAYSWNFLYLVQLNN